MFMGRGTEFCIPREYEGLDASISNDIYAHGIWECDLNSLVLDEIMMQLAL